MVAVRKQHKTNFHDSFPLTLMLRYDNISIWQIFQAIRYQPIINRSYQQLLIMKKP